MSELKPKLLVVDDEIEQSEYIKNYFSRRGFIVFAAATADEALASIKENKPDLVILDMILSPKTTGKDILFALRSYDKDTKVVMITGDSLEENEMQEIFSLGIVEFLYKPVDFKTLERVIGKVLKNDYPNAVRFEVLKPKEEESDLSLRRIAHDLSNIASDIANKCELYILDTEEGLNKDKSEKGRLDEALNVLKSVVKSTERLTELTKKISSLAKK